MLPPKTVEPEPRTFPPVLETEWLPMAVEIVLLSVAVLVGSLALAVVSFTIKYAW